mmetsp:Transcript_304/g.489  ORF Transcript_304/g.489 Transcript_304/m.489 type:complete len:380 (-) Transcript_304:159-1298(-)
MLVVPGGAQHPDGSLDVELGFLLLLRFVPPVPGACAPSFGLCAEPPPPGLGRVDPQGGAGQHRTCPRGPWGGQGLVRADEVIQLLDLLQLGVAVQQQRGVVGRGVASIMQLLQVLRQICDALSVQETPDDVRRFQVAHRMAVLLHGGIIVPFLVKMIAIHPVDVHDGAHLVGGGVGQGDGYGVEVLAKQQVKLGCHVLFTETEERLVGRDEISDIPVSTHPGHSLTGGQQEVKGDELVGQVVKVHRRPLRPGVQARHQDIPVQTGDRLLLAFKASRPAPILRAVEVHPVRAPDHQLLVAPAVRGAVGPAAPLVQHHHPVVPRLVRACGGREGIRDDPVILHKVAAPRRRRGWQDPFSIWILRHIFLVARKELDYALSGS